MANMKPGEFEQWKKHGIKSGQEIMIVMSDNFDFEYYPIYCMAKDKDSKIKKLNDDAKTTMCSIKEIVDLRIQDKPRKNRKIKLDISTVDQLITLAAAHSEDCLKIARQNMDQEGDRLTTKEYLDTSIWYDNFIAWLEGKKKQATKG